MNNEIIFDDVEGIFIGIDLGTSNSVVSYFKDGSFDQVKFKGQKIIPSVLYFENKDKIIFGKRALNKGIVNPQFMLKEFKTDLGSKRKYEIKFPIEPITNKEDTIYVIDTNIFIDEPLILELFETNDTIFLPEKVIDELTYREEQSETSQSAKMAIDSISEYKENNRLKISFESSHLDVLSDDLEKDSKNSINDNKILSIAKFYRDNYLDQKTVYLVTNDKGLRLKADLESILVSSLNIDELKSELSLEKTNDNILEITPKYASTKLLEHIKEESEKSLGEIIQNAVITVPANFNPAQIGLVKEAGEEAGFSEVRIQKEPVAVGFAYALEETTTEKTNLVYDFGGGTFDVSLLHIDNGKIEILGSDGNNKLGGKDITKKVVDIILDKLLDDDIDLFDKFDDYYQKKNELSIEDYKNISMISNEAERVKIELSSVETASVSIANLITEDGSLKNLEFDITRKEFETEIGDIKKETLDIAKNLLNQSNIDKSELTEIVMAGGSSLIPSIANSIKDNFGVEIKNSIDSSIVISQGAVVMAMKEWSDDNTGIDEYYENSWTDFGVGIKNNRFDLLIKSGSDLPIQKSKDYTTIKENQENLEIDVFQRKTTYPNSIKTFDKGIDFVDKIKIEGIPPRKVGELTIKVIFELTRDDSLEVDVKILENGKMINEQNLKVLKASNV